MGFQYCCTWTLSQMVKSTKRRLMLVLGLIILFKWTFVCYDDESHLVINKLCTNYESGHLVGNLCQDLCDPNGESSLACPIYNHDKKTVFFGTWRNYSVVFKSIKKTGKEPLYFFNNSKKAEHIKSDFPKMIKSNVKLLFNLSISDVDAKRMSHTSHKRYNKLTEMENVWPLLQHKEYLALLLYQKFEIFPKLLGTCGSLYAVQKLNVIPRYWHLLTIYERREEWLIRIKLSLMIMDFLLKIESELPEPLHICNIQINHFGVSKDFKKVMYLNIDYVHPFSIASKKTGDGSDCRYHSDCDFLDCRSFCDLETYKCQYGVANNNLQIVCEKIFLGLMMSGRVLVPGLLLGPHTPKVIVEVLELCANPFQESGVPRAPATPEIRKRLYDLLLHFKFILK